MKQFQWSQWKYDSQKELIENQAGSRPWRWNTSLTKRRKLFKPQVWNYGRIYSKLNQKETPKIPRGCGLFSLATWVPSVPSGSSRWPTTVGVLVAAPRPPGPPLSCPSVGSCSLLACHFDRSPAIEALLAGRARPDPPLPLPTLSAHLLATFGLLFTLAWATCLEMIASDDDDDDDYPNPRVAFRVSESVSVPCRRSCFVSVRFYRLCSCGFLDGFLFVGTGREKLNFSRHSSGRSWWRHPGSR